VSTPDTYIVTREMQTQAREDAARWKRQWRRERPRGAAVRNVAAFAAEYALGLFVGLPAAVYIAASTNPRDAVTVGRVVIFGLAWFGIMWAGQRIGQRITRR
jgi:protein-S-isoprenylcysteine O-methyltransferase Ste14